MRRRTQRTSFHGKDEKCYCCLIIDPSWPQLQECVSVGDSGVIYVPTRVMFWNVSPPFKHGKQRPSITVHAAFNCYQSSAVGWVTTPFTVSRWTAPVTEPRYSNTSHLKTRTSFQNNAVSCTCVKYNKRLCIVGMQQLVDVIKLKISNWSLHESCCCCDGKLLNER